MEPILLGIALVLALVIALLAIPLEVQFNIEHVDTLHGHVNIRWLFGLARFRIAIPSPPKQRAHKPADAKAAVMHKQKSHVPKIIAALKHPAFRRRLYQFIKRLFRAAHAHNLHLRLRIGLGDPADTGQLWALMGPVSAMAANLHHAEVHIEPEFIDAAFELQSQGEFRFIPLEFIALTAAFALSPPSLQAWRTMRRSNA